LLNLIPLEPLDGGRLVNLLLFYRQPVPEAGVLVVSAVVLALVGEFVFSNWVLLGLGVLILLQVDRRYATAKAAQRLVRQWPDLPLDLKRLTQTQLRDLCRVVLRSFPKADLYSVVIYMRQVHERAAVQPLPLPIKSGFLALYAGVIGLAFYSGAAAAVPSVIFPLKTIISERQGEPSSNEPSLKSR
jgi:hypothetical protein